MLAGAALGSADLWAPALGSAALYGGGVALNDACDLEKDRALHPDRPLPSGRVRLGAARAVALALLVLGVLSGLRQGAPGVAAAAALAAAIVVYDVLPDSAGLLGAVVLGLCRALNLARGGLSGPDVPWIVWVAAASHFVLIACVTVISLSEDRQGGSRMVHAAVASLPLWYAGPAIVAWVRAPGLPGTVVTALCAALAGWVAAPSWRGRGDVTAIVPRAVFTLSLVGALYCAAVSQWVAAAILSAFFPLSRGLARAIAQRGS
jgi:4-hydroxybenzoate polyprenyltransferase